MIQTKVKLQPQLLVLRVWFFYKKNSNWKLNMFLCCCFFTENWIVSFDFFRSRQAGQLNFLLSLLLFFSPKIANPGSLTWSWPPNCLLSCQPMQIEWSKSVRIPLRIKIYAVPRSYNDLFSKPHPLVNLRNTANSMVF